MKKTTLYVFVALILILSCSGAFLYPDKSMAKSLVVSATILSGLSALFTLIIAIIVFDRFGLTQKSQDKSFNTVLELYNTFSNLYFSIEYYIDESPNYAPDDPKTKGVLFVRSFIPDAKLRSVDEQFLKSPMVLEYSSIYAMERITKYLNNIFLPLSIKQSLDKFFVHCFTEFKGAKIYTVLLSPMQNTIQKKDNYQKLYTINQEGLTTEQFLDNYKGLKLSIRQWLLSHGLNNSDINIVI